MAVYAIGDIQGCYDDLCRLLAHIDFNPEVDQVWLAGDLVNRGPKSLEVLRLAKSLGNHCVSVLGNHDLHLLARAAGNTQHRHKLDTLDKVFDAPDADELVSWLRKQPLFYHDERLNISMVHAGLPVYWGISESLRYAEEVHTVLRGDQWQTFFEHMYGNFPDDWSESLSGWDRLRYITNCFTRLRYCYEDGRLALKFKGPPKDKPAGQLPWFEMFGRVSAEDRIVFGHWSTLGIGQYDNVFSLDSGSIWGGKLTAIRLDPKPVEWFSVDKEDEEAVLAPLQD